MKKLSKILSIVFTVGVAQVGSALNYTNTDLLLVFRGGTGANDVECDLGSVSNYLSLAAGTIVQVTNFDISTVQANFNSQLAGVNFALFATTSVTDSWLRVWTTDSGLITAPSQMAISPWLNLRGQMEEVGLDATSYSASSPSPTYVVPSGTASAYDYIASGGNLNNSIPNWHGLMAFGGEGTIPATLTFYRLEPSNTTPKPAAPLIGSFAMDANGDLTFIAGMVLSSAKITNVSRTANTVSVSFTTSLGAYHRLSYATSVTGPWTVLPTSVVGDGTTKTLTDTTTDQARFYKVVTSTN